MKAKIITNLDGSIAEGEHSEPFGTLQHVAHMPHVGVICQIRLGANGLQYKRPGMDPLVIRTEDLVKLFQKLEPKLAEAPDGNTRPQLVDELGAAIEQK